jgi:hypothetical protein
MSGPFGSTAWMANPASGFYDFPISNSLRFEDGDSPVLTRTPGSASNRKTFTYSCWVKITGNASVFPLLTAKLTKDDTCMFMINTGELAFQNRPGGTDNGVLFSNALFRDVSAWYNFVLAVDTTDSTEANRLKIYVNGVQITSLRTASYPSVNSDMLINSTEVHAIGKRQDNSAAYADGYMADINFIDGLQLTPSSFGETKNDIWIPKDTAGLTFGTNGFRLQFKQTGTGTASTSTIGADTSGETNHYTSANLVASDVMPDSPTNNFATLNPLSKFTSNTTLAEGNLKANASNSGASNWGTTFSSIAIPSTGKYYIEGFAFINDGIGNSSHLGVLDSSSFIPSSSNVTYSFTTGEGFDGVHASLYGNTVQPVADGALGTAVTGLTATTIDVMLAVDVDAGKVWAGYNGTWLNSGDPAAGSGEIATRTFTANDVIAAGTSYNGTNDQGMFTNFGQDSSFAGAKTAQNNADGNDIGDFYYAPPSGFLALCTSNLPAPVETIDPAQGGSPQDYFNTVLYTGNASTSRAIDVGFSVDWAWVKQRSSTAYHQLSDSVRGGNKQLFSNSTDDETTETNMIKSFDSNGITIGDHNGVNTNTATYVAWNWKAGTAFSNDASATSVGSIDSAGSVSADTGFSIISYTGAGGTSTVAHGLGVVPEMLIVKARSQDGENWAVYNANLSTPAQNTLFLNTAGAEGTSTAVWNNTGPTSSVFTVGNAGVNNDTSTYIAYCFASVDGYSKFGSYTGNGSTDGVFLYTGFRPAYVMIKQTNGTTNWIIMDTARDVYNTMPKFLLANATNAEGTDAASNIDFTSNGFKLRNSNADRNASGDTYIYMAFAEQPFKYANAR